MKAKALGVKLDQVLDALAAPQPMYRFVRLHAKAQELAGAVLDLGRSLLAAMEKRDGEALALLRQGHEQALLDAEREVRTLARDEARESLRGLREARKVIERRFQYYDTIPRVIPEEAAALFLSNESGRVRALSQFSMSLASALRLFPETTVGLTPGTTFGGSNLGESVKIGAAVADLLSGLMATEAQSLATTGGWRRRADEWKLQRDLAERELVQNDKQIVAQEIRVAMAEQELRNLDLRRTQSREVGAFLQQKFTNQELYDWMVGELAAEHYRAYQLAFDMAKRAERAYQLERGDSGTFVRFGAWDSLKKGLLAGERLLQDLRALDVAYLTKAEREREITKHVSLSELVTLGGLPALNALRDGGTATFTLPESLFDSDYPGHFFRRVKTVALSVLTVKAPQDGVQCQLTMTKNKIRLTSAPAAVYTNGPYVEDTVEKRALVTSSGEQDPGLFEVNLRDDMLLPFEGAGVISEWKVDLPKTTNRFPLDRVQDVVLHLRYTARDGRDLATAAASNVTASRVRVFSLRHEFERAWAVFCSGNDTAKVHELEILLHQGLFRAFKDGPKVKVTGARLGVTFNPRYATDSTGLDFDLLDPSATSLTLANVSFAANEPSQAAAAFTAVNVLRLDANPAAWKLRVKYTNNGGTIPAAIKTGDKLVADAFEDIWLYVTYAPQ